jgi:hypothetical protein
MLRFQILEPGDDSPCMEEQVSSLLLWQTYFVFLPIW